jgi:hypothetical protein
VKIETIIAIVSTDHGFVAITDDDLIALAKEKAGKRASDLTPGAYHELTADGERIVKAVAEGDFTRLTDREFLAYQTMVGKEPLNTYAEAAAQSQGDAAKLQQDRERTQADPSVRDVLVSVVALARLIDEKAIPDLIRAAEMDLRKARHVDADAVVPSVQPAQQDTPENASMTWIAVQLSVDRTTVRKWIKEGAPTIEGSLSACEGLQYRLNLDDLLVWLKKRQTQLRSDGRSLIDRSRPLGDILRRGEAVLRNLRPAA